MPESVINLFGRGLRDFMANLSRLEFSLGSPVLLQDIETALFDHTASISLTGHYSGQISFSASRQMLQAVLRELNHGQASELELLDLLGEITNGIVGCAQQHSPHRFYPSPPIILTTHDEILASAIGKVYCLELNWNNHTARLMTSVQT